MEEHLNDYLVIYDLLPTFTALDVLRVFERYGKILHFMFIGKNIHVGRAFLLYEDRTVNNAVLSDSGYFHVNKPEFEKMISSIKIKTSTVLVTPISDKEMFLLRRKLRSTRNKHLLNIGNITDDSIYPRETQRRIDIINERNRLFYGDAKLIVSSKTLHFYNSPQTLQMGVLRRTIVEAIRNYVLENPNDDISKQINTDCIRITKLVKNEDGSLSIAFTHNAYAMAALKMLNGNYNFASNFTPIIHFELKEGKESTQTQIPANPNIEDLHGDDLPDIPLFG
ncbi:hypothetical protein TVAG_066420 [Trichomonas vaginalis G3]|uniref:RRM domain-containing protein n=1 Tax=Trichomonas vaginalis (strain ATCC PRA-98 / G3) TaxID=412133 RepID=A2FFH5_TRIV3|nr:hypothetical protein TVAGG3_0545260 [Trichomonas vaginalis G3]EAX96345.1 hypothetical protein TVAG_066420 [Trichomonas vaginalis G3]KAI5520131.1 hypothetical protein TVAGG3_0545260 [Trichomonas vaginalis G3]|eukprot:XP_001309275.1 hypothetical protein [Trichomonas vaginalis G3]